MLTLPGEIAAFVLAALLGVFVGWLVRGRDLPTRRVRRGPKHAAPRRSALPTPYVADLSTGDVRVLPRNGRNGKRREHARANGDRIEPPLPPDTEPAPPGPGGPADAAAEPTEPAAEPSAPAAEPSEPAPPWPGGRTAPAAEPTEPGAAAAAEHDGAERDGAERQESDAGDAAGRLAGAAEPADGAAATRAAEAAEPEHPGQAAEDLAAADLGAEEPDAAASGSAEAAADVGLAAAGQVEPDGSARSGAGVPAGDTEPAAPRTSGLDLEKEAAVARPVDRVAERGAVAAAANSDDGADATAPAARRPEPRPAVAGSGDAAVQPVRDSAGGLGPAGSPTAAWNGAAPAGEPVRRSDDLRQVVGIGPVIHRILVDVGITTYRQLALLGYDGEALARARAALGGDVSGRIERQRWVEQARELHFRKYGERL